MNILEMPLMFVWYDMIDIGEKTEEYRVIKPYWEKRLLDYKSLVNYYKENKTKLHIKMLLFSHRPVIEDVCQSFPAGYTHIRFRRGYTKTTMMFEIKSISMGIPYFESGKFSKSSARGYNISYNAALRVLKNHIRNLKKQIKEHSDRIEKGGTI